MGEPAKFNPRLSSHLHIFFNSLSPAAQWYVSFSSWCSFESVARKEEAYSSSSFSSSMELGLLVIRTTRVCATHFDVGFLSCIGKVLQALPMYITKCCKHCLCTLQSVASIAYVPYKVLQALPMYLTKCCNHCLCTLQSVASIAYVPYKMLQALPMYLTKCCKHCLCTLQSVASIAYVPYKVLQALPMYLTKCCKHCLCTLEHVRGIREDAGNRVRWQ